MEIWLGYPLFFRKNLFNATFDAKEQRWKALQPADIFAVSKYGTEVYRNELACRLRKMGYEVEARSHGFEVKGVAPALIKRFSKRAAERDAVIAKMEGRLGRKLSNNEVSVAVHRTRSKKLKGTSSAEVRQMQLDQLSVQEIASLDAVKAKAQGVPHVPEQCVNEEAALSFSSDHVFERSSVVPEEELLHHALIHGRGQVSLATLKQRLSADQEFVKVGEKVSTRGILVKELELIESLNQGRGVCAPIAPGFEPTSTLAEDQQQAISHVLNSRDQFTGFRGLAGAGKTTALKDLSVALKQVKCSALFCAPTASATEVLRQDGFSEAMTLQRLLADPKAQQGISEKGVIVLDEAGLVGLDEMHRLFSLAVEKKARVVFSGDTGQHSGVVRGDALRLLEEHSLYQFGQIHQIRRQQALDYREAVELAASQRPQEAFDRLDGLGCVEEPAKLYDSAATAFLSARKKGRSALLVAPTWSEIQSVTDCVRSQLKKDGVIAKNEETVPVFDSLGWTEAQKCQPLHYSPGQRLLFRHASGSFHQNEEVEVISTRPEGLQVRREDGSEQVFRPKKGTSFEVGQRREIAVAPGDQLLLRANRRKNGLVNGEMVTVQSVEEGRISLSDGRKLPSNFRQFAHGYCVTSHASQSRTVDSVFLVASSRSAPAIHREQFYVSISRGRKECRIFTDDKDLLRSRIGRSTQREAALDLLRSALQEDNLIPRKERQERSLSIPRLRPMSRLLRGVSFSHYVTELSRKMLRKVAQMRSAPEKVPAVTVKAAPVRERELVLKPKRLRQRLGLSLSL